MISNPMSTALSTETSKITDPLDACTPLPDRMGPVFAKELRQGLRAQRFVTPFVAIQIFAIVAVGVELGLTSIFSGPGDETFGNLVMVVIIVGVGVVMPLTNIAALRPELNDGRNVELLLMSNLNRWQIVRGKWLVGFALSVLVLVSMIPYLLTRYFVGGVDLVMTLLIVLGLLFGNAALTGVAIGASGFGNLLGRFLLLGIGVFSAFGTVMASCWRFAELMNKATGSDAILPGAALVLTAALVAALYVSYGLQLGRARLRLFENPLDPPASGLIIALIIFTPIVIMVATAVTAGYAAWVAVGGLLALALMIDRGAATTRFAQP